MNHSYNVAAGILGSVWLRSQVEQSGSIPDSGTEPLRPVFGKLERSRSGFLFGCIVNWNRAAPSSVWFRSQVKYLPCFFEGERRTSGLGSAPLASGSVRLFSGSLPIPDLRGIFPRWNSSAPLAREPNMPKVPMERLRPTWL
jgi:hypothetical protein